MLCVHLYKVFSLVPASKTCLCTFKSRRDVVAGQFSSFSKFHAESQIIRFNSGNTPFYSGKNELVEYYTNDWFEYTQYRGAKIARPRDIVKFWKIRPGDKVVIISGKDKGKVEEVLMCDKLRNQVKVKGCNMRKLIVDSQLVQIEKKIHYSNVQLLDPMLNCGTKVTIRCGSDNKPLRVSKKSGCVIPWPEKKSVDRGDMTEGEKDTKPEIALQRTYDYKKDVESMRLLRQTMKRYNRELD